MKLKNRKTKAIKEVSESVFRLMQRDGRSRLYSVVPENESEKKISSKANEAKKEVKEIKLEDVSKRAYPSYKTHKKEPAKQDDINKFKKSETKDEGSD